MGKAKGNNSSQQVVRAKRRLQDYFDPSHGIVTPNQRSLPKYRNLFDKPRGKSKKEKEVKRLSQGRMGRIQKENHSPGKAVIGRSGQKMSRYEQSMGREYDSPSKEHEEIDFIFKGAQKKMRGNSVVENAIHSVNEHLKGNRLSEAIAVLNDALRIEPNNFDLVYLLGICYIFNAAYEEAIAIFEAMLRSKPKKNIYLLLSVCYKKTEKF